MISQLVKNFTESLTLFRRDKWLIILGMIPILIGFGVYYAIGAWVYGDIFPMGEAFLRGKISGERWLSLLSTLFAVVLTIGFYLLLSWTFILLISLIACPFNDLMSSRVEKLMLSGKPAPMGESINTAFRKIAFTIINELKKLTLVLTLSVFGLILSFFIPPLSLFLSCILVAVSFVDYNWGRNDMRIPACLKSYKKGMLTYTMAGGLFLLLISIPIINVFMIPLGVVYFARLFILIEHGASA
jgi:CysZ protein